MTLALKLAPAGLLAAAKEFEHISTATAQLGASLRGQWARLDSGWQSYCREDADGYFRELQTQLSRMSLMLSQTDAALGKSVQLLDLADQQAAVAFAPPSTQKAGGGGGGALYSPALPQQDEAGWLDWLNSLGKGGLVLDELAQHGDPALLFGESLILWRLIGNGQKYTPERAALAAGYIDPREFAQDWSDILMRQPEIHAAILEQIQKSIAGQPGGGHLSGTLPLINLEASPSMLFTLHGSSLVTYSYDLVKMIGPGGVVYYEVRNAQFFWNDRGDLHPGIGTTVGGISIDDGEFSAAGKAFDIGIPFGSTDPILVGVHDGQVAWTTLPGVVQPSEPGRRPGMDMRIHPPQLRIPDEYLPQD